MKQIKKPNLKRLKTPFKRRKPAEERVSEAFASVPRITNETVAEHREEVLSSARKYIYPLRHSKHRVVRISVTLFVLVVIVFFVFCWLELYNFQSTSSFMYDVTQVVPFPVAKAGPNWVSYQSYLFELRRNVHYYQTQQGANFSTAAGKSQLNRLKTEAMAQVILNAYVTQLAHEHHISVSSRDVDNEVSLLKSENRLGSSDSVFNDVLEQYWGWNETDFKRELKQQLLQQAVVAKLDTRTLSQATAVLEQLQKGGNFAQLAAEYSADTTTKSNGGQYPNEISKTDQTLAPQVVSELFQLKTNQVSPIINTGYSLEILKVLSTSSTGVQAAHIQFNFQNINVFTNPLQKKEAADYYISI
jgi:hypothetical protein